MYEELLNLFACSMFIIYTTATRVDRCEWKIPDQNLVRLIVKIVLRDKRVSSCEYDQN